MPKKPPKSPKEKPRVAYILVGLPACGKTTFRNDVMKDFYLRHHNDEKRNMVCISTDDVIDIIATTQGKTYNEVWGDNVKEAEKIMRDRFDQAINGWNKMTKPSGRENQKNQDLIIDRTNLTKKSRAKFLGKIPSRTYAKVAVCFEIPPDEIWEARLNGRPGKMIPQKVIQDMVDRIEFPTLDEGFDEIITVKGW